MNLQLHPHEVTVNASYRLPGVHVLEANYAIGAEDPADPGLGRPWPRLGLVEVRKPTAAKPDSCEER